MKDEDLMAIADDILTGPLPTRGYIFQRLKKVRDSVEKETAEKIREKILSDGKVFRAAVEVYGEPQDRGFAIACEQHAEWVASEFKLPAPGEKAKEG